MDFILKLKHWQIFLILALATSLSYVVVENNATLTAIISFVGGVLYFFWLLMIGHGLYQLLPRKVELNYNLFVLNSFIWLAAYAALKTLTDGNFKLHGLAALAGFYVLYALLYSLMFPARCLNAIEKGKKAGIGECIGDFFLFMLWPIGIWILQPRINKVMEAENVAASEVKE